jgi:hypothetical protein
MPRNFFYLVKCFPEYWDSEKNSPNHYKCYVQNNKNVKINENQRKEDKGSHFSRHSDSHFPSNTREKKTIY